MTRHELIQIAVGLATLALSLYVAFGPLRHRLPRILTRLGKWSATLKLMSLAALCGYGVYRNIQHHGSFAMRWWLTGLGVILLGAAAYVVTRRSESRPSHGSAAPAAPR